MKTAKKIEGIFPELRDFMGLGLDSGIKVKMANLYFSRIKTALDPSKCIIQQIIQQELNYLKEENKDKVKNIEFNLERISEFGTKSYFTFLAYISPFE